MPTSQRSMRIVGRSANPRGGVRLAIVGDSIGSGKDGGSPVDNTPFAWFDHMCIKLKRRARRVGNFSVPGTYSSDIDSQITTALVQNPDVVFINTGTNDPVLMAGFGGYGAGGFTTPNVVAAVQRLINAGVLPIIVGNIQRTNYAAHEITLRRLLRGIAFDYNIPFIDFYGLNTNLATGAGNGTYTSDGVHPTAASAALMADMAVAQLADAGVLGGPALDGIAYDGDPTLIAGSTFSSGSSSGIPTGWTEYKESGISMTPTVVAANGAVDDCYGFWLTLTKSAANGYHGVQLASVALTAGNTVEMSARVRTTSMGATVVPHILLDTTGNATNLELLGTYFAGVNINGFVTARFTVPTAVTTSTLYVYFENPGTAGVFEVGELSIRDLTVYGDK